MKIIKSTRNHKLWYHFPYILEFPYHGEGLGQWFKYRQHFEDRYGPDGAYVSQPHLGGISILTHNSNYRLERNSTRKRLRIYVKEPKDITWAQLTVV